MIMRWIFALFLIATGFYLMRGNSSRHLAIRRMMFFCFVMVGLISLLFQNFWTNISRSLGVNSGTELLTYIVAFGFIASTISNFRWRRDQEKRIVELAREITLQNSKRL